MEKQEDNLQNSSVQKVEDNVKQTMDAAKNGVDLAKNVSTGNYVGAAKDAVNLLKNKKVRRHLLINTIASILIPILIILLIAGLYMAIISAIGDIVANVVDSMGDFFSGIGNWFASLFDPDSGKFIITINEQKFQELKSSLSASGINAESSNLTDECLKLFLLAQYKTQYPEDVVIKIEVSEEEKQKIEKRGRGNTIETEDIDGDGQNEYVLKTAGCIQLFRPEFTNDQLRYVEEKTLDEYKNEEKTFDDVKGKYSIDSNGNLILPQKKTVKYIKGDDDIQKSLLDLTKDDNYDWESFNKKNPTSETVTPSLQQLPYQSVISAYSMPFEFLTILTTFTQNSEFGVAVADLVNNKSSIKLNILDNSKTTEERKIYQYNSHTKVKYKVGAKTIVPNGQLWIGYSGNIKDYADNSDREMLWKPDEYNYETNTPRICRENTITTEYTTSIQLSKAETWMTIKESSYSADQETAHLDSSMEKNPQIYTPSAHSQFNYSINNQNNYIGTQDLYDNDSNFKDFIENYYKRDTNEWYVSNFKNDLLEGFDKNTMENYVNNYIYNNLMEKFYRQELNLSYSSTGPNQSIFPLASPKDQYYNNLIKAINDYKNQDTNWKIDSNSYDVMPYNINNKRESEQVKKAYYVSEKTYITTSAGPAQDNTDEFLKLLVTGSGDNKKYVYYTNDSGSRKAPGSDLASAPDMFFKVLAGNTKTVNLENAMRYIMYRMTGEDYGVTDFNSALVSMSAKSVGSDYNVTDQSIFITDVNKLKEAIKSLNIGGQAEQNLLNNADGFMQMQQTYHINAAFAVSATIVESSAGTAWAAIDSSTYNWYSIKGSYNGQSLNGWRKYTSFNEATKDFGDLIANSGFYCPDKCTISQIAPVYCDEAWGDSVRPYMKKLLEGADIDLSNYSGGGDTSRSRTICPCSSRKRYL